MPSYPLAIEIQTVADCNSKCIICPNDHLNYHGHMEEKMFERIINEIAEWDRDTLIILYLNGEPFLDRLLIERITYVNKKCPKARIELSTNLSLVDDRMVEKLQGTHIDDFRISFFGFSEKTYCKMMPGLHWEQSYANLKYLLEYPYKERIFNKISVVMIRHPFVPTEEYNEMKRFCEKYDVELNIWGFLDRAGNVIDFSNDISIDSNKKVLKCEQNRPTERLHIYYDGDVVLCCQDWRKSCVLGNVAEDSLIDIWRGEKYEHIRAITCNTVSQNLPEICRHCKLMEVR